MSVILYGTDEIAEVFSQYKAWQSSHPHSGPTVEQMGCALIAAHYANCSAYAMSYQARASAQQHDGQEETISFDAGIHDALEAAPICWSLSDEGTRELVRKLGSLLYNAASNGGTDFMPAKYRHVLEEARMVILQHLAGMVA